MDTERLREISAAGQSTISRKNALLQEKDVLQETNQGETQNEDGKLTELGKTPEPETGALVQEDNFQEPVLPPEPQLLAELESYPGSGNVQPVKSLQIASLL